MNEPDDGSDNKATHERAALAAQVGLDAQGRITRISDTAAHRLGSFPGHLIGRSLAEVALEARDAAMADVESLAYAISHDLRAPLRHLQGFASLLKSEAGERLDQEQKHYLDVMGNASKRMGSMIEAVLEVSRIQRASLRHQPADMLSMVREGIARAEATEPGRRFEWKVDDLLPITGDRALLRQLWGLLLANAVKFTRGRDPAIVDIRSTRRDPVIEYSVRDNGAGLEQAYVGKLFTLFQRLHTDSEFPGLGTGLALASRIVARHGGTMRIEGETGVGACVTFTLPARDTGQAR